MHSHTQARANSIQPGCVEQGSLDNVIGRPMECMTGDVMASGDAPMYCIGDGMCTQSHRNANEHLRLFSCESKCQPKKCPNCWLCGNHEPQFILYSNYHCCINCAAMYASRLPIIAVENTECNVCMHPTTRMTQFQQCSHSICMQCFAKMSCHSDKTIDFE